MDKHTGEVTLTDTREDIEVGTGERLEIVQVAKNRSDDVLKTEKASVHCEFDKKINVWRTVSQHKKC